MTSAIFWGATLMPLDVTKLEETTTHVDFETKPRLTRESLGVAKAWKLMQIHLVNSGFMMLFVQENYVAPCVLIEKSCAPQERVVH